MVVVLHALSWLNAGVLVDIIGPSIREFEEVLPKYPSLTTFSHSPTIARRHFHNYFVFYILKCYIADVNSSPGPMVCLRYGEMYTE